MTSCYRLRLMNKLLCSSERPYSMSNPDASFAQDLQRLKRKDDVRKRQWMHDFLAKLRDYVRNCPKRLDLLFDDVHVASLLEVAEVLGDFALRVAYYFPKHTHECPGNARSIVDVLMTGIVNKSQKVQKRLLAATAHLLELGAQFHQTATRANYRKCSKALADPVFRKYLRADAEARAEMDVWHARRPLLSLVEGSDYASILGYLAQRHTQQEVFLMMGVSPLFAK